MPARTRLICNADDFGLSPGISAAILQAHAAGVISSTTLMSNMPAAADAVAQARDWPRLGIGVHLNLTLGAPLSAPAALPDLLAADGRFLDRAQLAPKLRGCGTAALRAQLLREFDAQIEQARALGVTPTHLDSHQHIANLPLALWALAHSARRHGIRAARSNYGPFRATPGSGQALHRLSKNLRLLPESLWQRAARAVLARYGVRTPQYKASFTRVLPRERDSVARLLRLLDCLPAGSVELGFHPGPEHSDIDESPRTVAMRASDRRLLADAAVRARLQAADIELIRFDQLD